MCFNREHVVTAIVNSCFVSSPRASTGTRWSAADFKPYPGGHVMLVEFTRTLSLAVCCWPRKRRENPTWAHARHNTSMMTCPPRHTMSWSSLDRVNTPLHTSHFLVQQQAHAWLKFESCVCRARIMCLFWFSSTTPLSSFFAHRLLSYHLVLPPAHQLHLPGCGGPIPSALQLMRTLAPLPSTTLSWPHTVDVARPSIATERCSFMFIRVHKDCQTSQHSVRTTSERHRNQRSSYRRS